MTESTLQVSSEGQAAEDVKRRCQETIVDSLRLTRWTVANEDAVWYSLQELPRLPKDNLRLVTNGHGCELKWCGMMVVFWLRY